MLDWVIIGGGIHGVHIAARLIGEVGVDLEHIRIVDPGDRLLERWRTFTATTGMRHLRSPSVHNLDMNPWSLMQFAGKRRERKKGLFAPPFNRPSLDFFNDHCDKVIGTFELSRVHVRAKVEQCSLSCDRVSVVLSTGEQLSTANVVLAIGSAERPNWPQWAPTGDPRVQHVFSEGFDGWPRTRERVVVVGGGISAGQVALRLVDEGHDVQVVSRHGMREHQFDSDPGWLGPRNMKGFLRETNVDKRRSMIRDARHKGSVPPDVRRALNHAIEKDQVQWIEGQVEDLHSHESGFTMKLASGDVLEGQRVLLATGFASQRPGGRLVDHLVESAALPCASCGYPIVDKTLRWHPRVYVSGPLAELELGPSSRNIAGARRAADRLVAAARSQRRNAGGVQ